jgi:2-C-methyl-D-erythritol 4-phosphate cytidylyltransferase
MKTYAIIPSAGRGKRAGTEMPKQYHLFNSKEMIIYTLETFQHCPLIDEIIIAADKEYFELLEILKKKYNLNKITKIVEGGRERQHSVSNALFSIDADDDDLIAVHDAARALLPQIVLENALNSAKIFDNIVVAINARDTLIKGEESVADYLDRSNIYYAQTPQVFRFGIITEALRKANEDGFIGTDESMIVKRAGYEVKIVEGSSLNFKITSNDDIKLFEIISRSQSEKM